jgi:signal transduction histidine kinase
VSVGRGGFDDSVLRDRLAESEAEIASLNAELAETNKGVVALYAELDDKAAQLREASELKSRFLSYMSHEFRTPLGSIRSLAGSSSTSWTARSCPSSASRSSSSRDPRSS